MRQGNGDDRFANGDPQACPTAESMDVIGTEWRLNVLYDLQDGEMRFNELKEATGASSRTLSQALDALMDAGLVERRSEEAAPIAVYYRLTDKGDALGPVFDELDAWTREWYAPSSTDDGRSTESTPNSSESTPKTSESTPNSS